MLIRFIYIVLLGSFFTFLHADEQSAPANIFASANNKFVLPVFIENFYRKYPDARVVVQYGASGDLARSILNSVNYDVFLSADMKYPQKIYAAKKALKPPVEYTRGSLILFVPPDSAFKHKKLKVLNNKNIKHITIANKKTAPYGKATIEVLKNAKLLGSLRNKIRYSTDISTVITNVIWYDDAGFLSKSAVRSLPISYRKEGVHWIEVDESLYKPIVQGYVVSKEGAKNINVVKFLEYMHSDEGRMIYKEYGYK